MKNKKTVIGFALSALAFGAAGVVTAFTGGLPAWFGLAMNAAAAVAGALGVTFAAPNKGE
jgi:hypothetical protein